MKCKVFYFNLFLILLLFVNVKLTYANENEIKIAPPINVRVEDTPADNGVQLDIYWEASPTEDIEGYTISRTLEDKFPDIIEQLANNKSTSWNLRRLKAMLILSINRLDTKQRHQIRILLPKRQGLQAFTNNLDEYWSDDREEILNILQNKDFVSIIESVLYEEEELSYADSDELSWEDSDDAIESRLHFTYTVYAMRGDDTSEPIRTESLSAQDDWIDKSKIVTAIPVIAFTLTLIWYVIRAKRGDELYVRPITGIQEVDNAIGRATEMGRPILFIPGLSTISDVATIAGLTILGRVAQKAAEYDTPIFVPVCDIIVLPVAQEIVKGAYMSAGRPDGYNSDSVFFITFSQFAYVAGVCGLMAREKPAANFYMGMFWAESLIMTEKGNQEGSIQIAGTDADTQLPFFITTCDYTLIGEELYAASAYLAREPLLLGTLKAQDVGKLAIVASIILGTIIATLSVFSKAEILTSLLDIFPKM